MLCNISFPFSQVPHLFRVVQLLGLVPQDRRRVRAGPRAQGAARRAQGPPVGQGTGAGQQIRMSVEFVTCDITMKQALKC